MTTIRNMKTVLKAAVFASVAAMTAMTGPYFWDSDATAAEVVELTQAQETLLKLQLKERYACDFEKILFAREIELGGTKTLEGRVRCADEREVDFSQANPNMKFQLELCQPTVC